ncbi:MAG: acyl carrier protein [Dysgonamonadaceae bacterium]|jgi:acyl carrier protein|nr:acyl carrier protein [Dysgonamonadaceae bacterium]
MSQVAEKVKELIAENLSVDKSAVTESASFTIDLGADSLDTVELIMAFEKAFNMKPIPDDQAQTIQTVGDAIAYIEAHTEKTQD